MGNSEWHTETDRLGLRTYDERDLDLFLTYRNDPEIARLQGWDRPYTETDAREFLKELAITPLATPGEWHQFAVVDKTRSETVGDVGLHVTASDPSTAEVGYTIAPQFQRNGYAAEAVAAVIEYAFEVVGVRKVIANALAENEASRAVASKVGMALEKRWQADNGTELVRYAIVG